MRKSLAHFMKESAFHLALLLLSLLASTALLAQKGKPYLASSSFQDAKRGNNQVRVAFYNVENLFDYFNDSTTSDEDFTPLGERHWTKKRYQDKLNSIAKAIVALGGWEPPAIVGLCEVENRYVLESLVNFTQLKSIGYQIVHQDSPDQRGIDVAVLYRPQKIELINYEYYSINFPQEPSHKTRDILHFVSKLPNKDTLHYLVNHWPSKFGGEFETQPKRMYVATFLRQKLDSLLTLNSASNIVVGGDFNDDPEAKSIIDGLRLQSDRNKEAVHFTNLMYPIRHAMGTHSFENKWSLLDQFIVSTNLLTVGNPTTVHRNTAVIFDMEWLLVRGATGALRPLRTFQGPMYIGGFSDHLPIYLDLIMK